MALAGAGNPTSTEDLPMTLSMLKQQYTTVASIPERAGFPGRAR